MALDIHRENILVGAWNEEKDWVLTPRRGSIEKFGEWAKKKIRTGDIVVLETTTNVWTTYDIVAPLASRVLVANAAEVSEIANARVKTDKEDVKRLLKLLLGATDVCAGIASIYLLSWTPGQDRRNTCTCSAVQV